MLTASHTENFHELLQYSSRVSGSRCCSLFSATRLCTVITIHAYFEVLYGRVLVPQSISSRIKDHANVPQNCMSKPSTAIRNTCSNPLTTMSGARLQRETIGHGELHAQEGFENSAEAARHSSGKHSRPLRARTFLSSEPYARDKHHTVRVR